MELFLEKFRIQEYLLFVLLGIAGSVIISNMFGVSAATEFSSSLSIILSASVLFLSIFMVSNYGIQGNHGKSWILFMIFAAYWFFAEFIGPIHEFALGTTPWEYADDFFYIVGYQLFFASLIFYLKPFKNQISKKLILGVSSIAALLLVPSLFFITNSEVEMINNNIVLAGVYTILDSVILIPALIGVVLFFKGEVNFMFSLISLGIVCQIIGDNSVLYTSLKSMYYSGHPIDILFLWTYTLFSFGLFNQLGLFNSTQESKSCPACGKSCNCVSK
ncbi:MAG: hypothetical protein R3327_08490 [Nitrosopumilaceae archaeon]|nr:hypothetical protein [Nitrosopumilaceae archaeon]